MPSFKSSYRALFKKFGYPLTKQSGCPEEMLVRAEKRLGVKLPKALRDFYAVAGMERRFSQCHNRLLPLNKLWIDRRHLVFMEENQNVAFWAVSTRSSKVTDPAVYQGVNNDEIVWNLEHRKCSVFLVVMFHFLGTCGGFRYCGQGPAPEKSSYRFEDHGWTFCGEVNSLQAYSRLHQIVCLMPPALPFMPNITVWAGGKTKSDLNAIALDLAINFD